MIHILRANNNKITDQTIPPGTVSNDEYELNTAYQPPKPISPLGQSPLNLLIPIIGYALENNETMNCYSFASASIRIGPLSAAADNRSKSNFPRITNYKLH